MSILSVHFSKIELENIALLYLIFFNVCILNEHRNGKLFISLYVNFSHEIFKNVRGEMIFYEYNSKNNICALSQHGSV